MIIKCLNCGGALKYDPVTQQMTCDFCISSFDPELVGFRPDLANNQTAATTEPQIQNSDYTFPTTNTEDTSVVSETTMLHRGQTANYIDYNIYTCSSCGAEVAINGVESATFCVYCGQPTIILDRVKKGLAPDRIIPFAITKERAVQKIHEHFEKIFLCTEEVSNCTMDCVRGIYVPYWLIDMDYETQTLHRITIKEQNNVKTLYDYNWVTTHLEHLTIDASRQLNNSIAHRLDPYNLNALKPFDVSYLSGYYADCGDVMDNDLKGQADSRAMSLVNAQLRNKVAQKYPASSSIGMQDIKYRSKIQNAEYVMLPAWFMTYRYNDCSYTVLVNGQTGKVVGEAPYSKRFAITFGGCFFVLFAVLLTILVQPALDNENTFSFFMYLLLLSLGGAVCVAKNGWSRMQKYKHMISTFQSSSILDFISKRQGGDLS